MELQFHSSFDLGTRWRWPLHPQGKSPDFIVLYTEKSPQIRLATYWQKKNNNKS
jgi:hypothetical protein